MTNMKFAHNLVAVTFGAGCVGLWVVMRLLLMLQRAHPFPQMGDGGGKLAPGAFEEFCFGHAFWLPFFALPALGYALFVTFRERATVESLCVFGSVLAFAFTVLMFTVAFACMIIWIPLYD